MSSDRENILKQSDRYNNLRSELKSSFYLHKCLVFNTFPKWKNVMSSEANEGKKLSRKRYSRGSNPVNIPRIEDAAVHGRGNS